MHVVLFCIIGGVVSTFGEMNGSNSVKVGLFDDDGMVVMYSFV